MHYECFGCDIRQMKKISAFLHLSIEKEAQLTMLADNYLQACDMTKTNPEIMQEIWSLIKDVIGTDNPYQEIKAYYNQLVLSMSDSLYAKIRKSDHPLEDALKLAIAGNLIDFAAKHTFDERTFEETVRHLSETQLAINHSNKLFHAIENSRTLLYLGDNCGEIVLDKLFIVLLKEYYPHLQVFYGVRGKPIVNDVTVEDAKQVQMHEAAEVLSNGDGALGTVLHRTSAKFQACFQNADTVLCKGQGNYEGLSNCHRKNLFFLFMAKCDLIAKPLGVDKMSIVCIRKE